MTIGELYNHLFDCYGPQGWWPVHTGNYYARSTPPTERERRGYHPGDYSVPDGDPGRFEICVGAILTQNTTWLNVERAIFNLIEARVLDPERILAMGTEALGELIRPSGYFNVKARKLMAYSEFHRSLAGRTPTREELLGVWGVGPETADNILLYAYGVPVMVIDAYTRRIFAKFAITKGDEEYEALRAFCERELQGSVAVYQEFHALLVEHGKELSGARIPLR
jgi:endonuclease-3 related protein